MSKITSKNLIYDNTLPPFLARLQATSSSIEAKNYKSTRPRKVRDSDNEAEDEPVYFDEGTRHTFTKNEWESKELQKRVMQVEDEESLAYHVAIENDKTAVKATRNVTIHGIRKKRQIGKVVGAIEDENQQANILLANTNTSKFNEARTGKPKTGDRVKNGKKIKLSFDD